jgi:hypothetical protein
VIHAYNPDMNRLHPLLCRCVVGSSLIGLISLSGCAVVAVADVAVTAVSTVVSTGVKATGAVIDAVIPDSAPKK